MVNSEIQEKPKQSYNLAEWYCAALTPDLDKETTWDKK